MPRLHRSRINFSVKTDMQLRLLFRILAVVFIGTAVTSTVFYYYANKEIGDSFKHFHVTARNFLDYLIPAILVSAVLGFLVASAIAFLFPHTFAGPLFRIENDLVKKIGKGDLTVRFNLRSEDELKDLAGSLNTTLEKLSALVGDIISASGDLTEIISNNNNADSKKLKEAQENLAAKINRFKISQ